MKLWCSGVVLSGCVVFQPKCLGNCGGANVVLCDVKWCHCGVW